MAGLNELMKIANKLSSDDYSGSKGLIDMWKKFNVVMKDMNESINRYSGGSGGDSGSGSASTSNGTKTQQQTMSYSNQGKEQAEGQSYDGSDMDHLDNNGQPSSQAEGTVKRNKQMAEVQAMVASQNSKNAIGKKDIFSYDITDERLVDGLIFSEILGKPMSKRRHERRHGRLR